MDTAKYSEGDSKGIDFDNHSFGDYSCNGETISYVPDMLNPSPPFPSNLSADHDHVQTTAFNTNNPWFNPFDDLCLPSMTSMVHDMVNTDDDDKQSLAIPILGAIPITTSAPMDNVKNHEDNFDNLSSSQNSHPQLRLPPIDYANSQSHTHSFYNNHNSNPPQTDWPEPITLPLQPFVFDPPLPPMTVDPVIMINDDPFNPNYPLSDYQRYQQLMAANARKQSHSSSSNERTESSSPPNSIEPKTPSFQRSVFHSPQDQCFGANECGQTYLSSEDEPFRFVLDGEFDLKMTDISMSSMQNYEKSPSIKSETPRIDQVKIEHSDEDNEEKEVKREVVKGGKGRKRRRRRCRNYNYDESRSRSPKIEKTEKKSSKKMAKKAKKQLKRGRKSMQQKNESSKRKNSKRRRLTPKTEPVCQIISGCRDPNEYIEETMTTKQCRVQFHEMIKRKEVVCTENGNWCNIGKCKNKRFGKKCHLKRHVDEEHIGRRFRCVFPGCLYDALGKSFRQKGPAKEHINNTHFKTQSQWRCCFCEDPFSRYNGVKRHLILKRCKFMKKHCDDAKIEKIIQKVKDGELQAKCKVF